jgi:hypothetical protein
LIHVSDDARVEQRRRFEGVLIEEICTDQSSLIQREGRMLRKGVLHLIRPSLEYREQIPVAPLEILQNLGQQGRRPARIERQSPVNYMVRPFSVRDIEITRFHRRSERTYYDPGRIRAQIQALTVKKFGLWQKATSI